MKTKLMCKTEDDVDESDESEEDAEEEDGEPEGDAEEDGETEEDAEASDRSSVAQQNPSTSSQTYVIGPTTSSRAAAAVSYRPKTKSGLK